MTETIANAFDTIANRAAGLNRDDLDHLIAQMKTLDEGAKVAISLGGLSDHGLIEAGTARRRAIDATDAAFNVIMRRQLDLISTVPEERVSKETIKPMTAPALLLSFIKGGSDEVIHIGRELGAFVDVLRNGDPVQTVDPYCIQVDDGHLVVQDVGRWPLIDIEAASCQEGFSFLLADGTLFEITERG